MNLYGRDFYDDAALVAEIKALAAAKREVVKTGYASKIGGEGRLVEWTRGSAGDIDTELREAMYEARERGLSIGGDPGGAITVEIG